MSKCRTHIPIKQLKYLNMDYTGDWNVIINTHKKLYFLMYCHANVIKTRRLKQEQKKSWITGNATECSTTYA